MVPDPESGAVSDASEIVVARQHCQVVPNAQLSQERVDGSNLHTIPAASIPQLRRFDVIVPVGHKQGYCREPVNDPVSGLWAGEPLQKLLQNKAGRNDGLAIPYCPNQRRHFACNS
jgi:hypothetical protein